RVGATPERAGFRRGPSVSIAGLFHEMRQRSLQNDRCRRSCLAGRPRLICEPSSLRHSLHRESCRGRRSRCASMPSQSTLNDDGSYSTDLVCRPSLRAFGIDPALCWRGSWFLSPASLRTCEKMVLASAVPTARGRFAPALPGLKSWAILVGPYGTGRKRFVHSKSR